MVEDTANGMTLFELSQHRFSSGSGGIGSANSTLLRSESKRQSIKAKQERRQALYLDEGQAHMVWKPKRVGRKPLTEITTAMQEMEKHRQDLHERQQKLLSRVQATREVLKVHKEELATLVEDKSPTQRQTSEKRWRTAITKVMEENEEMRRRKRNKKSLYFHEIVTQYVAAMAKEKSKAAKTQMAAKPEAPKAPKKQAPKKRPPANTVKMAPLHRGAIPLRTWKSLVFDDHLKTTTAPTAETRQKHLSQPFEEGSRETTVCDHILEEDGRITASVGDITQGENKMQSGTLFTFTTEDM